MHVSLLQVHGTRFGQTANKLSEWCGAARQGTGNGAITGISCLPKSQHRPKCATLVDADTPQPLRVRLHTHLAPKIVLPLLCELTRQHTGSRQHGSAVESGKNSPFRENILRCGLCATCALLLHNMVESAYDAPKCLTFTQTLFAWMVWSVSSKFSTFPTCT